MRIMKSGAFALAGIVASRRDRCLFGSVSEVTQTQAVVLSTKPSVGRRKCKSCNVILRSSRLQTTNSVRSWCQSVKELLLSSRALAIRVAPLRLTNKNCFVWKQAVNQNEKRGVVYDH